MPSEQQFVELGRLVREARSWFSSHQAANSEALGEAIVLAQTMLRPWAGTFIFERLDRGVCEVEDLLSQAAEQIIDKFASLVALTGKEFYKLMKRMVEGFVHDLERRRYAFRRQRGGDPLSLERDAQAARLVELLVDEQPTPEALAILGELKNDVRRVTNCLSRDERRAVRMIMQGISLAQMIDTHGPKMRVAWRSARLRLREGLSAAGP